MNKRFCLPLNVFFREMRKIKFLFCLLWTLNGAYAQIGEGVYTFLNIPVSSYAAGLGGTSLSSPEQDLSLSLHNPALLSSGMHNHLALGYMNYVADIHFGNASYARNINGRSAWMFGARYLHYGSMQAYDEYNRPMGDFLAKDMAFTGGYSFVLGSYWQGGGNVHLIYSIMDEYTSIGMLVDLGVYYKNPEKNIWAGAVVKSLGTQFAPYSETYESMPWDVQVGITKELEHAPFRFSLTTWGWNVWHDAYTDGASTDVSQEATFLQNMFNHFLIGLEFLPSKQFHVTLGYNVRRKKELALVQRTPLTGFSGGFSMYVKKFRIGASYAKYHASGGCLQLTLSANLDKKMF